MATNTFKIGDVYTCTEHKKSGQKDFIIRNVTDSNIIAEFVDDNGLPFTLNTFCVESGFYRLLTPLDKALK